MDGERYCGRCKEETRELRVLRKGECWVHGIVEPGAEGEGSGRYLESFAALAMNPPSPLPIFKGIARKAKEKGISVPTPGKPIMQEVLYGPPEATRGKYTASRRSLLLPAPISQRLWTRR